MVGPRRILVDRFQFKYMSCEQQDEHRTAHQRAGGLDAVGIDARDHSLAVTEEAGADIMLDTPVTARMPSLRRSQP